MNIKIQIIQFIIMVIVGILFNPMNILSFRINDLYLSLTLFYGGLLMASNMIWSHQIVHFLSNGHFNKYIFFIGIILSILISIFLRQQLYINDNQWLKRMISHHSTALTTSHKILNKTNNPRINKLATEIINTQMNEIELMKSML